MRNHHFALPGDTFKSEEENAHFHRGMTYKVSKVFQSSKGYVIIMEDKHGFDVPMNIGHFEPTGKSQKLFDQRIRDTRLRFFWDNLDSMLLKRGHHFDWEKNWFFGLSKAHFLSERSAIAQVTKYQVEFRPGESRRTKIDESCTQYIYKYEDFQDYFKKHITENEWDWGFGIPGLSRDQQLAVDHPYFVQLNEIPVYDEKLLNLPEVVHDRYSHSRRGADWKDIEFPEFVDMMSELIFDKPKLTEPKEKTIIKDMMYLYKSLPSSHSGTSISKILTGKSKHKNQIADPLRGKYKDFIRYDQVFELCTRVEDYLYQSGIFATKEEYSSGEEWRGTFEFIGSKYIDNRKLNTIMATL